MKLETGMSLHNHFYFRLEDAATGELKQEGWAYNLVTDKYYQCINSKESIGMEEICLGTGTGTPAGTDTDLFNRIATKVGSLSIVSDLGGHSYSQTLTTTFTEEQANGNLTEVGICATGYYYWALWTHAMLTDAEGHTITIEKTNTDRLTVTATMYLSITYPQGIIPFEEVYDDNLLGFNAIDSVRANSAALPWLIGRALGRPNVSTNLELRFCLARNTPLGYFYLTVDTDNTVSGIRATASRVISTAGNFSYTWQTMGIWTSIGVIPLPNHTLFPPVSLELEQVGDGSKTGFNFGIAELTSDIAVYVDGVLQPSSAYTWNRKDFSIRQAWISQHGDYLISQPRIENGQWRYFCSPIMAWSTSYASVIDTPEFVYDFGSGYTVNALASYDRTVSLYYSSDKTNWTLAATVLNPSGTVVQTFSPITARYWKTVFTDLSTDADMAQDFRPIGAFDYVTNQLEFNTPPANGSVIKIETKTEYPIKNSNWIIDQVVQDITITRSAGS